MDRQTTFLLALGMLVAASLVVGLSGLVLFARDRALARDTAGRAASGQTGTVQHPEAPEER